MQRKLGLISAFRKDFVWIEPYLGGIAMELRHLRYFVAVADEGNFTRAAEKRLHTAQPSLSRQIRDLEAMLKVPLIVREPRGISLTSAGQVFFDHARLILVQVDAAIEAARRAHKPAKTRFTIGFLTGHEIGWLPQVLRALGDKIETMELIIHSASSPELLDALAREQMDVAFVRPDALDPGIAVLAADRRGTLRIGGGGPQTGAASRHTGGRSRECAIHRYFGCIFTVAQEGRGRISRAPRRSRDPRSRSRDVADGDLLHPVQPRCHPAASVYAGTAARLGRRKAAGRKTADDTARALPQQKQYIAFAAAFAVPDIWHHAFGPVKGGVRSQSETFMELRN